MTQQEKFINRLLSMKVAAENIEDEKKREKKLKVVMNRYERELERLMPKEASLRATLESYNEQIERMVNNMDLLVFHLSPNYAERIKDYKHQRELVDRQLTWISARIRILEGFIGSSYEEFLHNFDVETLEEVIDTLNYQNGSDPLVYYDVQVFDGIKRVVV